MTEVDRHCENCGKTTKHKVEPFFIPHANQTANTAVDLTGRTGPPAGIIDTLPQTMEFTCTICGARTVEAGQTQGRKGTADTFSDLQHGKDWAEPPK